MNDDLSALAVAAQGGSKEALDSLVQAIQRPVYNIRHRVRRTSAPGA